MDPYAEYNAALDLVRKAQRRGDAVQAERWARVARAFFNNRRWIDEAVQARLKRKAQAEAARADARRKKAAEIERLNALNPRWALAEEAQRQKARSDTSPPGGDG